MRVQRFAVIPDIHVPFVDHKALAICLDFVEAYKPHHVFQIGDLLDCYELSNHDQLRDTGGFDQELEQAKEILFEIRARHPSAEVYFHLGNHEHRLKKFIAKKASPLRRLKQFTWPELLELEKLDIHFCPWLKAFEPFGVGNFRVEHGKAVSRKSGYTAYNVMDKRGQSG